MNVRTTINLQLKIDSSSTQIDSRTYVRKVIVVLSRA